jgi:hypothetical protein
MPIYLEAVVGDSECIFISPGQLKPVGIFYFPKVKTKKPKMASSQILPSDR